MNIAQSADTAAVHAQALAGTTPAGPPTWDGDQPFGYPVECWAHRCPYCRAPFVRRRYLDAHTATCDGIPRHSATPPPTAPPTVPVDPTQPRTGHGPSRGRYGRLRGCRPPTDPPTYRRTSP